MASSRSRTCASALLAQRLLELGALRARFHVRQLRAHVFPACFERGALLGRDLIEHLAHLLDLLLEPGALLGQDGVDARLLRQRIRAVGLAMVGIAPLEVLRFDERARQGQREIDDRDTRRRRRSL